MHQLVQKAILMADAIYEGDTEYDLAVAICVSRQENPNNFNSTFNLPAWRGVIVESILTMQIGTHIALRQVGTANLVAGETDALA